MSMDDEYVIDGLTQFISDLIRSADNDIRDAQERRWRAVSLQKELEQAYAQLRTQDCPFCAGTMVDTTPLKPLVDQAAYLSPTGCYDYTPYPHFGWICQRCHTYHSRGDMKASARRWSRTSAEVLRSKSNFASEVFAGCAFVDEVAREQVGREWLFRIGATWYANSSDKQTIRALWDLG